MSRNRSIREKLLTDQVVLILLLGGALLATTFLGARRAVETLAATIIERSADQAELKLRRFFDPVTVGLLTLRSWGEAGLLDPEDPERLRDLIVPLGDRLPQVGSLLLADGEGKSQLLVHEDDGWRDAETDDPRSEPWYLEAVARRGAASAIYWSDPDEASRGEPFLTASLAYGTGDEEVHVVAFRVPLDGLAELSHDIEVSERGDLWVLTAGRRLLAWPDDAELWQGRDPGDALLRRPPELGLTWVDDAVRAYRDRSPDGTIVTEPIRFVTGGEDWWSLGRPFVLADERQLLITVSLPHDDLLGERHKIRLWILALTLVALAAAVGRAFFLARGFSRPIEALVGESDRIRQGDLDGGRPIVTSLLEIRQLGDAQERMRRGLRTLMKLEGDLQLARQIQQRTFPRELPRLAGFDLVAWSQPADETGGDTYDVVGLDDDGLLTEGEASSAILLLADATGHGVGPALSVTQLRSMLRMAIRLGSDFKDVATHVNEQLYADLPGNRFITAWLGRLRAGEGSLQPFSAGQAPILLYRAADDRMEVTNADAPPLGLLPALPILLPPPVKLLPGDVYAVFSDGFFEAVDPSEMEFGKERLTELIRRHRRAPAAEILAVVRAALEEFTGGAPPDDDRTALLIKSIGK